MITMPWQIAVACICVLMVAQVLRHLRHTDCEERIRAAKTQQHRDTMANYRDGYKSGWQHGKADQTELDKQAKRK